MLIIYTIYIYEMFDGSICIYLNLLKFQSSSSNNLSYIEIYEWIKYFFIKFSLKVAPPPPIKSQTHAYGY